MRISKAIQFFTHLALARITGRSIPLVLSLTVTNRCNLRCIYCYGAYYDRDIKDFPAEVWFKLINEAADMGTMLVHLEGCEPLLRPDIGGIIDAVKKRGMICRMNSNGLLVPKRLDDIAALDSLCISLDGDAESNDRNRGSGTYAKIVEGIQAAKKKGIPLFTSTVLTKNNIDTGAIESVLELSKKIGFAAQFSFLYEQTTTRLSNSAFYLEESSIRDALKKLIGYKKKGYPVFYSYATYHNALNWPVSYAQKRFYRDNPPPGGYKYIACYMGRLMCFVDGDGLVYPCGEHIGNFPALNFLEVGFKKAWENVGKKKDCLACYNTCFNEYNQIFHCRPSVLWNIAANHMRKTGRPETS